MLEVGQVLGDRYQIQRQLSCNPVRETWLAVDLENSSQVVVKLLTFGAAVGWENLKLFEREASVLKQLDHARIPKYRDYFCVDEQGLWFVLVEDYIPGCSFQELLARGRKFSELEVQDIAKSVLQILIYLHAHNPSVLHRDIKPNHHQRRQTNPSNSKYQQHSRRP